MKNKGLLCAVFLGITMVFCGTAYAEGQEGQQVNPQSYVYQTADGVLSIQTPDSQWHVVSDSNYWFVLSDGANTITIDHLANGEALPAPAAASGETEGVCQTYISTKNEVFVARGSAVSRETLDKIIKIIGTIQILKYDTKTANNQADNADGAKATIVPINETYYCVSDDVNVRSGWSTDDPAVGSLKYGEPVNVLGSVTEDGNDTGWYQISYNGSAAYVSSQFLSRTKPEGTASADTEDAFVVYAEDGSTAKIHSTGGGMFEDNSGRTYSSNGDGTYSCVQTGVLFASVPDYWSDVEVNVEGDPYGDLVTGGDGNGSSDSNTEVNVEGDPYGDLVTGSDGNSDNNTEVNVEGDPYGEQVTGSDGNGGNNTEVNVEGDPYGDLVTGGDGEGEVNVEG